MAVRTISSANRTRATERSVRSLRFSECSRCCSAQSKLPGVMASAVEQRLHEIGIRMALGASPSGVIRMMLRFGLTIAAVGVAIGLVVAAAASKGLTVILYKVNGLDRLTFLGVGLLFALVTAAACYIPARRGADVDPWRPSAVNSAHPVPRTARKIACRAGCLAPTAHTPHTAQFNRVSPSKIPAQIRLSGCRTLFLAKKGTQRFAKH